MGIEPSFPAVTECVTLDHDGFPLAIGGNVGDCCWLVTSDKVEKLSLKAKLKFRKLVIEYRDQMLERYESLWNFVYIENEPHIRFLKSIGAEFQEEYTCDGKFQLFIIRRKS
ncbi:DUF2833 domain-containing protein [Klebsiella pneumoniae]|nr:DUF2833 domain-containing protein [Klebsiella pneumoniae]